MAIVADRPKLHPLTPVRLSMFARTHVNDVPYRSPTFKGDSILMIRDDGTELVETFEQTELKRLFDERKVRIDADYYNPTKALTRAEAGNVVFKELAPEEQQIIVERKGYCDHLLKLITAKEARKSGPQLVAAIRTHFVEICERAQALAKEKRQVTVTLPMEPSEHQVRRWLKRYESADFDPLALLNRRRRSSGNRKPRLTPEVRALVDEYAARYISSKRPSIAHVYDKFFLGAFEALNEKRRADGKDPLDTPNVKALERAIRKLNKFHVIAGRHKPEWAKKHFSIVNQGLQVFWPLQRVEIDEWHVQLHVILVAAGIYQQLTDEEKVKVDRTRLWITAAVCCTTRCLLSLVIHTSAPSTQSALACLKLIFVDKSHIGRAFGAETSWSYYGRPDSIFSDNGKALSATEVEIAALMMGCEFTKTPPSEPGLRARIERLFGTISRQLLPHFTGRTFSNVVDKGLYDPKKAATLTVDEFAKAATIYLVDAYHHTPHEGLFNETPFDAWNRLKENWHVDTLIDPDELRHVFGLRLKRTITNSGIEIAGLHYQSRGLMEVRFEYRLREVEVRVDPEDLSRISIETPKGFLSVDCVNEKTKNFGLTEWIEGIRQIWARNTEQSEIHLPVLFRAAEKLKAIAAEAEQRTGIIEDNWTTEKLEKVLNDHLRLFKLIERAPPASHGLFGNVVEDDISDADANINFDDDEEVAGEDLPTTLQEIKPDPNKSDTATKSIPKKLTKTQDTTTTTEPKASGGFSKWRTED